MAIHVVKEAQRCLQCKNPLCQKGCPVNTPIPDMIKLFLDGKGTEAGKILFENNPLSLVCALVCDHDKQCEGHCVQGIKGSPIHWSSIEAYISEGYMDRSEWAKAPSNHVKAAIIGSGPAGITIAITLAERGYDVTLFDSRDRIGGVLRYGIPAFRLPKSIIDEYHLKMERLGIRIRPNTSIGGAITVDTLFEDGYKSVFIGTGVWRPHTLRIKGESLGNVHYAINYLASPEVYHLGKNVAVIGAGNAAMDVARTVIRQPSTRNVDVYVRRDHAAASEIELDYAMADGVRFHYCMAPVEVNDDGPVFKPVELDENGNITGYGEPVQVHADSTIISIGQGPKDKIAKTTKGLDLTEKGLLWVDKDGETSRPGVFGSGDVTSGAKTVVEAVKYSKLVADAMDKYMQQFIKTEPLEMNEP